MADLDRTAVQLVRNMKAAINDADRQLQENGFKIEKVDLELKTVLERSGGGGIHIKFLEVGGSRGHQEANTLSLTLVPDPTQARTYASAPQELVAAVIAAAAASREAADLPPAFKLTEATVSLQLGITTEGEIRLFVGGSGSREQAHTMTISLVAS